MLNMYSIIKDHFKLVYNNDQDIHYIELAVNEETKNHKPGVRNNAQDKRFRILPSYIIFNIYHVT